MTSHLNTIKGVFQSARYFLPKRSKVRYRYIKNSIRFDAVATPYKTINVSLDDIRFKMSEDPWGSRWESLGRIEGGDWDGNIVNFNDEKVYYAVKKHFCENIPWEETGIIDFNYEKVLRSEDDTYTIDGCKTRNEFKNRYNNIDKLYSNILNNGYNLIPRNSFWHHSKDYKTISVHIGRNGDLIFTGNGNHRLAIAKVLELEEIPVKVLARHKEWQDIRDEIYNSNSVNNMGPEAEKHLGHPDTQNLLDKLNRW